MSHKYGCLKLIALLVLFVSLGGCTVAKSDTAKNTCFRINVVGDEACSVIEGFSGNILAANLVAATISGGGRVGFPNQVTADMGAIGGGVGNQAGDSATVAGGSNNIASGLRSTVGGGAFNTASSDSATVGGGYGNTASHRHTTVCGGDVNAAIELDATVGGGSGNIASERWSTVGGGTANAASGSAAAIAGGTKNTARAAYAAVGGGSGNIASGIAAAVGGGAGNIASGDQATIAGGLGNRVTDNYSTVGGGRSNIAGNLNSDPTEAMYATVGGGTGNVASGSFSVVPGGLSNSAGGEYSFAAGRRSNIHVAHSGTFLYADSNDADFNSTVANEFAVRATGGVRFVTSIDVAGTPAAGVRLAAGGGSWESFSDRSGKTNSVPVDGREILERVMRLPLATWSYKTQAPSIRHIGPMAQDFYAVFGVGEDDQYINSVDADGVALAAIQGLYQMVLDKDVQIQAQQQRIEAMEAEIAAQQNRLTTLEARLAVVEKAMEVKGTPLQPLSASLPASWSIFGGLCILGLALAQRRRAGN